MPPEEVFAAAESMGKEKIVGITGGVESCIIETDMEIEWQVVINYNIPFHENKSTS